MSPTPPNAILIAIGNELTSGSILERNNAWIAQQLETFGYQIAAHHTLPDHLDMLASQIRQAMSVASLLVISGGLGPTDDDITREALARALNVSLHEDTQALQQIQHFFAKRNRPMPESNRRQAYCPDGLQAVPNNVGSAPGIYGVINGCRILVTPGVPNEMKAMFAECTDLFKPEKIRQHYRHALSCFGESESTIGQCLHNLTTDFPSLEMGTTVSSGRCVIRLATYDSNADVLFQQATARIENTLKHAVFSHQDQSIASSLVDTLKQNQHTLALAESLSCGLGCHLLGEIPGCSSVLRGGMVTYQGAIKSQWLQVPAVEIQHKVASAQVAYAMAEQIRNHADSHYGVSCTGVAGPGADDQGTEEGVVYFGLSQYMQPTQVYQAHFGGTREHIRMMTAQTMLAIVLWRARQLDPLSLAWLTPIETERESSS